LNKISNGSLAVAEAVHLCGPQVVSVYTSTMQMPIIEHLAHKIADAELSTKIIFAESEFAAASVAMGAMAAGVRTFIASTPQELLLMSNVLFNIASLRLPVVMVCTNRATNMVQNNGSDHHHCMAMRDAGWIQLYVASNQEAVDSVIQAYRIAEHCELPVMIWIDSELLTHTFEPEKILDGTLVKSFLPDLKFSRTLDTHNPLTLGGGSETEKYQKYLTVQHCAMDNALDTIQQIDKEFSEQFGRSYGGGLVEPYCVEDAETIVVGIGALLGTTLDVVDQLRDKKLLVGALRIRYFRPFPAATLVQLLTNVKRIIVIEKSLSAGAAGVLTTELRAALYQAGLHIPVNCFVGGFDDSDVMANAIEQVIRNASLTDAPAGCRYIANTNTADVICEPVLSNN